MPAFQTETPAPQIVLVTGASSGFGRLSANAVAHDGHTVYAAMRETTGRNAPQVADVRAYAGREGVDLRAIELDVGAQPSVDEAVADIVAEHGRIDVVVHNAGHMAFGPAEAFTPEQFAQLFDINVLSTQRVNRAALPQLRRQGRGLVVWISSSSARGGTPPYLAPYFAAKAAMDSVAVSYAGELARWGIETAIIVPGAFTKGTNHFAHSGSPADKERAAEYDNGPNAGLADTALKGLAALEPADADAGEVAKAVAGDRHAVRQAPVPHPHRSLGRRRRDRQRRRRSGPRRTAAPHRPGGPALAAHQWMKSGSPKKASRADRPWRGASRPVGSVLATRPDRVRQRGGPVIRRLDFRGASDGGGGSANPATLSAPRELRHRVNT
jgi:NAD(P)-dependent dehydrogenase (short-subunit alcohol dehydrogenase family)